MKPRSNLRALSIELDFTLTEHDIDQEAALRARYDHVIPVVVADGREVARAPFAIAALRELLAGACA